MFHEGSEFMYWPRSYRKNPYNLMRGYRGFDDGFLMVVDADQVVTVDQVQVIGVVMVALEELDPLLLEV